MFKGLIISTLLALPIYSHAELEDNVANDMIDALYLNEEQAQVLQEDLSNMTTEQRRDLTVCGSVGGGVILSIDIFRCHDVNNNDYLMTFKGFGLSAYAKAGIVYIHSKRPILPGFYRAHEFGFHTGFGGYAIKFKNNQTKFTIRGLTYGIGLEAAFGKAEVKVLN